MRGAQSLCTALAKARAAAEALDACPAEGQTLLSAARLTLGLLQRAGAAPLRAPGLQEQGGAGTAPALPGELWPVGGFVCGARPSQHRG